MFPTVFMSFVGALHPRAEGRAELETAAEAVATAIDDHWRTAREAWPDITIPRERFASELSRRLGTGASLDALVRMRASDVYLAIACADGDGPAIARFEREFLGEVDFAARKIGATADQSAEVKGHLRRILFVDEPGRPAALREFAGRGRLGAYVRVMATRDLVRAKNRGRRDRPVADEEILDRLAPHDDPELGILRAQYREVVDDALRAAVAAIDDRTRALLRYQLVDRWTVDQVGQLYGVHRATAARWIAAARAEVGERIRAGLAARLAIDPHEVASIIRLVQSRVDVSLDRLLGTAPAATVPVRPPVAR